MLYLYFVLLTGAVFLLIAGIVEQRRHYAALHTVPTRVLVNGIRGKSSITRLCAGALRGGGLVTVAKTTGTAARFIHPDATEEPVYRKFGIANVVEQIGIVRRAAAYRPHALVIECMAVIAGPPGGQPEQADPLDHRRPVQRPRGPPRRDGTHPGRCGPLPVPLDARARHLRHRGEGPLPHPAGGGGRP